MAGGVPVLGGRDGRAGLAARRRAAEVACRPRSPAVRRRSRRPAGTLPRSTARTSRDRPSRDGACTPRSACAAAGDRRRSPARGRTRRPRRSPGGRPQRFLQRARLDQAGARGVDEQRGRLHAREVGAGDDAARRPAQPHVQRQHVGLGEELPRARSPPRSRARVPARATSPDPTPGRASRTPARRGRPAHRSSPARRSRACCPRAGARASPAIRRAASARLRPRRCAARRGSAPR